MHIISILCTLLIIFTAYKAGRELRGTLDYYAGRKYVGNEMLHSHQHIAGLLGILGSIFLYLVVIYLIAPELLYLYDKGLWIPSSLVAIMLLYVIKHFEQERIGLFAPIRFRTLFLP